MSASDNQKVNNVFAYQLSSISLPCRNLLPAHCQVDGIDLNAVTSRVIRPFMLLNQTLIVIRVRALMKASRQTEIRQFEMASLIDQDIIRFDIAEADEWIEYYMSPAHTDEYNQYCAQRR